MILLCDARAGTLTNRGSSFEDFSLSGADPSESTFTKTETCQMLQPLLCSYTFQRAGWYRFYHWTDDDNKPSEASLTCGGLLSFWQAGFSTERLSPGAAGINDSYRSCGLRSPSPSSSLPHFVCLTLFYCFLFVPLLIWTLVVDRVAGPEILFLISLAVILFCLVPISLVCTHCVCMAVGIVYFSSLIINWCFYQWIFT